MNKEELEKEIEKTKEQLNKLQQALRSKEYERWKPEYNEKYYVIDAYNEVLNCRNYTQSATDKHVKAFNCFKTREEAEAEAEKILVRRKLEDIAKRLNKGKDFNWYDINQSKFYINYNPIRDELQCYAHWLDKVAGAVFCLDESFLDVAIEEIGKERLTKYLKEE